MLSLQPVVNRPLSDRAESRALVPTVLQLPLQPAGAARDWYQGDATGQTCLLPNLPHYSALSGISGLPSLRSCSGSPAPGGPQSRWAGASWGPGWWSGATPARGSSRGRPGWSRLSGYSGLLSTCLASTLARSPPSSKRRKGVIKSSYSVSPPFPPWLNSVTLCDPARPRAGTPADLQRPGGEEDPYLLLGPAGLPSANTRPHHLHRDRWGRVQVSQLNLERKPE